VTTPEASTVATAVLEDDQVPLVVASAKVVVDPAQTTVVPVMAATVGRALTVTEAVELETQPEAFVTV
jgi:hypothetical protein